MEEKKEKRVLQIELDDGLLLLHNMTKEMVLLSKEEQRVFEHCPTDLPELQGVLCRGA